VAPSRLTVLATRPAVLLAGAVGTTLIAFLAAMFLDNSGQRYGLPSLFYLAIVLAALGQDDTARWLRPRS
jgi:hypothetical protein